MNSLLNLQKIRPYLEELHKKAYKNNPHGGCTSRAQLLYLILKKNGYQSRILRYFIKGEEEKDISDRKKLTLLSGSKFPSHVVILLENYILDPNIGEIFTKKEYEKNLASMSDSEITGGDYDIPIDYGLCKQYAEKFDLTSFIQLFN